jgi:hypothetical protein
VRIHDCVQAECTQTHLLWTIDDDASNFDPELHELGGDRTARQKVQDQRARQGATGRLCHGLRNIQTIRQSGSSPAVLQHYQGSHPPLHITIHEHLPVEGVKGKKCLDQSSDFKSFDTDTYRKRTHPIFLTPFEDMGPVQKVKDDEYRALVVSFLEDVERSRKVMSEEKHCDPVRDLGFYNAKGDNIEGSLHHSKITEYVRERFMVLRAIGFHEAINEMDSKGDAEDEAAEEEMTDGEPSFDAYEADSAGRRYSRCKDCLPEGP